MSLAACYFAFFGFFDVQQSIQMSHTPASLLEMLDGPGRYG